jgi:hypothetical protein
MEGQRYCNFAPVGLGQLDQFPSGGEHDPPVPRCKAPEKSVS